MRKIVLNFLEKRERPYRFRRGVKLDGQLRRLPGEIVTAGPSELVSTEHHIKISYRYGEGHCRKVMGS